jgi:hypothetical protein
MSLVGRLGGGGGGGGIGKAGLVCFRFFGLLIPSLFCIQGVLGLCEHGDSGLPCHVVDLFFVSSTTLGTLDRLISSRHFLLELDDIYAWNFALCKEYTQFRNREPMLVGFDGYVCLSRILPKVDK